MTMPQLHHAASVLLVCLCALVLNSRAHAQDAEPALPGPGAGPPAAAAQPAEAPASSAASGPIEPGPTSTTQPPRPDPALILDNKAPAQAPQPAADGRRNHAPEALESLPPLVGTEAAPAVENVVETPTLRMDLWGRLRQSYGLPALDNDLVRKWEQYYATRPDYMQRMLDRGGRYLFHIVEEVSRREMPAELALLPFVESAFNPHAISSARASGIWQFMPATGRSFDLRQNVFRDDRRSVLESTRAALDYLKQLHGLFGDWHLALAAYNWGQGNVGKALSQVRRQGRAARYDELSMPDETRNYVPKLQAIANLVARPEQFGLQLPALENHPYFLTVRVDRDMDVTVAARLAGLSLEEFQALNPQMNKPVILAAGTPLLLLPFDNAHRYQQEVRLHRGPFATWTAWVAPATLNPAEVARRVGMSEAQLREVNRIPPRMLVKAGSTLLVPRLSGVMRDVSEHVADTASISLAPEPQPGRKVVVRVGPKGESVAALAQRYRVGAAQVASWNSVSAAGSFKPGQQVVVYAKAAAAASNQAARGGARALAKAPTPRQAKRPTISRSTQIAARTTVANNKR